ncbi:protein NO VEIN domain-containing protein [Nocardioides gilvus]|uniref:protein NO VEIN domain-containing protein n=1 Tax=Nocardioides gilvus TaxID=1735589 RepID=UPI0013A59B69|nr:DUF3883 domain-containing protein [Nocardioides gilvus]
MRLPPEPVLLAAKRWLEILPTSGGVPRAQALLTTHARYSDLSPTQYATALTWLRDLDLLEPIGSQVPAANQVLGVIFEKAAPPWVQDADDLVRSPEELPTDITAVGEALGLPPAAVYEQLISSWGKVDTAARERVGAAGEEALVGLLREKSDARVEHVSTWSDGFGYDVAYSTETVSGHLEVKSTTRLGRFTAYLSRNEYDVMLRDPEWVLVTVRLTAELNLAGVGSVPSDWLAANAPRDVGAAGTWAAVKLNIPAEAIVNGIPHLGQQLAATLPRW